MKTNQISAYVDLSLAMAIVGSSVVCGKVLTNAFPVFLASGLRFALAAALMLPLILLEQKGLPRFGRKDWGLMILMAFCGQFVFTCLLLYGLRFTGGLDAGVITATTPAAMTLVALVLLRERPGRWQLLGVTFAVGGVLLVNGVLGRAAAEGDGRWLGNALICLAVLGEALFLLLRKRLSAQVSNLALAGVLCWLGLFMFAPFALVQAWGFDFRGVTALAWWALLYFGVVFTVVAYLLWFRGVVRVSGGVAGVFTAVMPVSALGLSCLLLGETLTWHHALGGAMVVAAILCSCLASPGPSLQKAPEYHPET